jgi:hypothetical protein
MIATMTAMIHNRLGDMTTPPPLTVATATGRIGDRCKTPTAATNELHRASTTTLAGQMSDPHRALSHAAARRYPVRFGYRPDAFCGPPSGSRLAAMPSLGDAGKRHPARLRRVKVDA